MEEEEFGTGLGCRELEAAEDRHKLLIANSSNEEESALHCHAELQAGRVQLESAVSLAPGESWLWLQCCC